MKISFWGKISELSCISSIAPFPRFMNFLCASGNFDGRQHWPVISPSFLLYFFNWKNSGWSMLAPPPSPPFFVVYESVLTLFKSIWSTHYLMQIVLFFLIIFI